MKLAIMQPYLFPYFGYFQLIHAVDTFLFLDDVNFKKGGWMNRNKILGKEEGVLFTVPLKKVSQHKHINELEVAWDEQWKAKFLKSIRLTYSKAPCFSEIFSLLENIISQEYDSIAQLAGNSVGSFCKHLDIETALHYTSEEAIGLDLKGQDRILEICKTEGAKTYINTIAGLHIYEKPFFIDAEIGFFFLESTAPVYQQKKNQPFIPNLSIIDVLMYNDKAIIRQWLDDYKLV